jgi:lipopolysaccharide/colanic/teichoic acid biosynthesis glycosyltransferase
MSETERRVEARSVEAPSPWTAQARDAAADHRSGTGQRPSGPVTPDPDRPSLLLSRLNERGFRLVMVADALWLLAIMVGGMLLRFGMRWPTYPLGAYLLSFATALAIMLASLYFGGLYEREPRLGAPSVLPRAARQTLAAGGIVALVTLAASGAARELGLTTARALPFPIINLVGLIVVGALAVALNRFLVHRLRTRREGSPKVLLAGEAEDLEVARAHLEAAERSMRILATVDDAARLPEVLERTGATDVLVVTSGWVEHLYPDQLAVMNEAGVTVLLRIGGVETLYGLERLREIGGLPFVLSRPQTMPRSRARFKRFFDLVLLAVLAVPGAVLLGLVSLYQLVVVGRPLLYRQIRVGAQGEPFEMVKFRTMHEDAEADGRGARLAAASDPRVVPGCGWIRAARLDELPQLWNVLRGEMSLVGPRPERPELTAGFETSIPGYARRHELPPGMTGLAQIHGRYHTDAQYKLGYDLQYLVNWSPVLDLEILLRTFYVVVARRV